ncbi:MAG TPA: hypothetical protein VEI81_07290 [Methanoregula sp.]|nr:hypothetical protein [Methanoregula sp.]
MKPPLIPPMACDLVQAALAACDGLEFTELARCPACGGDVAGHDIVERRFAVIREEGKDRVIRVKVKRFSCKKCKKLSHADEPFYPDTRLGSPVIDLCRTLSAGRSYSRAATILETMGVIVDRTSCLKYGSQQLPVAATADVFGLKLPLSVLAIDSLAARAGEGGRIKGAELLVACGLPSTGRAAPEGGLPAKERDEGNEEE